MLWRRRHHTFASIDAHSLFDGMPERIHRKNSDRRDQLCRARVLDSRTLARILREFVSSSDLEAGKGFHALAIKSGFSPDRYTGSAIADFYSKFGLVGEARKVFDDVPTKDQVLWNVAVSTCASNGLAGEAFKLYGSMRASGFLGDEFTFSSLCSSCASLACGMMGKQIHALALELALDSDACVATALVDMYGKCGDIDDARQVFDFTPDGSLNSVSWNSIIVAYGVHGGGAWGSSEAMNLLLGMLRGGRNPPDELTFASVLRSCGSSAAACEAAQLHSWVLRSGFDGFQSVRNALVAAYAKCGSLRDSNKVFSLIEDPDLVAWSSMISSFALHGRAGEAINALERMLHGGLAPDGVAFLGVLFACSHAGLVEEGLRYFDAMEREHNINLGAEHYACLVDLLARAGRIDEAHEVLVKMPVKPSSDVLAAFMGSCRVHGRIELAKWAARKLFDLDPGAPANWKAVSGVLAASGCWDEVTRVRREMRDRSGGSAVPGCSWVELGARRPRSSPAAAFDQAC